METTIRADLLGLNPGQLGRALVAQQLPAYRVRQIYKWLHSVRVTSFAEMTDLPLPLRQTLTENFSITKLAIRQKQQSAKDDTVKYLLSLPDGETIEAVLMQYRHGASLCISTQVGCRMGCTFCASTLGGLKRNLTVAELLAQVYTIGADSGKRIGGVVLMGIGEPLDNFDNVVQFLEMLSSPEGLNLSLRHVSLSTCGLVDKIYELAKHKLGLTLSVSLHAHTDTVRSKIMPVNKRHPIKDVFAACDAYFKATGRRVSFEYSLIDGVNASPQDAAALVKLLAGRGCHINLIPINPVRERSNKRATPGQVAQFAAILKDSGVTATIRRELGGDISAACGQLRQETV